MLEPFRGVRLYFNSRPREGANLAQNITANVFIFQFPPPRGGEHEIKVGHRFYGIIFQFPPPRGGEHNGVRGKSPLY